MEIKILSKQGLGGARDRLSRAARAAAEAGEQCLEYRYLPEVMGEPYFSRRCKLGYELYRLYGIDRQDFEARQQAMLRNFDFFGAPVGLSDRHILLSGMALGYGDETAPENRLVADRASVAEFTTFHR